MSVVVTLCAWFTGLGLLTTGCGGASVNPSAAGAATANPAGGAATGGSAGSEPERDASAPNGGALASPAGGGASEACPPQQWDCSAFFPTCLFAARDTLPAGCACDRSRPLAGDDCATDETIACLQLETMAKIQCSCVKISDLKLGPGSTSACVNQLASLFPAPADFQYGRYIRYCITPSDCSGPAGCTPADLASLRKQGVAYACIPALI